MKNIPCISIEDAIGKTVAAIVHNGWDQRVVIKFTDGTFLAFHAEEEYDVLSLVCLSELNLMRDIYDNDDANTLGLLSQRKACIEEHDKEMQRVHEEQERQTFERLKKKFEQ